MIIKKISKEEFVQFASNHPLRSYHQSPEYATYMESKGYKHEFIALVDEYNTIHASSLILYKKLGFINKYGYAPKGFLIDYYDEDLLKIFVTELKKFYYNRNFAFIKINPEIAIGQIDEKTNKIIYNNNATLIEKFIKNGFIRIGPNYKFETLQPRFNAIIPLKKYSFQNLPKTLKNKIRKTNRKGLKLICGKEKDLPTLYEFVKNIKNRTFENYVNYYKAFSPINAIDIFLVEVDYEEYLINSRNLYQKELDKNAKLVEAMIRKNTPNILKKKMESDRVLLTFKNDIILATKKLSEKRTDYIAGAITIKYQNRISIIISGFNKKFKRISPNHFLYNEIIKYYQKDYDFIDLNGITGDFNKENPYYGLNKFKMNFKPKCFEYIGEFDIIINPGLYRGMKKSGLINDEFQKKQKVN